MILLETSEKRLKNDNTVYPKCIKSEYICIKSGEWWLFF